MGYEYVPESWRKKFKVGQTVWYLDHINNKIIKGKFAKYVAYEREYSDCVKIESNRYSFKTTDEVLESWTFTNRTSAYKCLKSYLRGQIKKKSSEMNCLKSELEKIK
jgi:hypothetical protein